LTFANTFLYKAWEIFFVCFEKNIPYLPDFYNNFIFFFSSETTIKSYGKPVRKKISVGASMDTSGS